MKTWIGTAALTMSLVAGCGGSGMSPATGANATPTPASGGAISASLAERAFNDAVNAALRQGSGVTVQDSSTRATLDGAITADDLVVTFSHLALTKKPFSADGTVSLVAGAHTASIAFSHSIAGALTAEGASAGAVNAKVPMESSFVQAEANWALRQAWIHPMTMTSGGTPGQGSGACNVTVTDDGNGGVVLDGSCAVCGATVTFTMLDINPTAMTINGTITIDDGNGNTATLTFNGTTVDVKVNGQDLGTFDLSQIFGGP